MYNMETRHLKGKYTSLPSAQYVFYDNKGCDGEIITPKR